MKIFDLYRTVVQNIDMVQIYTSTMDNPVIYCKPQGVDWLYENAILPYKDRRVRAFEIRPYSQRPERYALIITIY